MMSQAVLATGAGAEVVADADGDGVTQAVELGLAEAVAVGGTVAVVVGATVGAAVVVGAVLGGAGWWGRQRRPEMIEALVTADALGDAESEGTAEAVVAGVVVPVLADDDTHAAPVAASLVALSFAPELDEKRIPAATPRTATSITAMAPMRARGRSSKPR